MRVVVVGAGIGGLVTAVAAHRSGHEVTVIDRAAAGSAAGAGISLFGNALSALDAVPSRLGARVRAIGGAPVPGSPVGIRTPNGRWLVRSTVAEHGRLSAESEVVVVHRADLHRVLLDELPPGMVQFDSTCTAVQPHADGATVSWTGPDGPAAVDADLVVAADGINSRVRRSLWIGDPGTRYAGYTSWRGITSGPVPISSNGETWGRGERFGYAPMHDGRVYWFATASLPPGTAFPDDRAEVLRRFGGWHDPIPTLIGTTSADAVLHHDINDLAKQLGTFVNGRVVLLGDSAHAMTPDLGQGGCQAMEDAVTLVALINAGGDLRSALHSYDELRRSRTQPIAARARRIGRIGQWQSRFGAGFRDTALRLLPGRLVVGASEAIARWAPPA
jgi:2-polyprenyl-6-methoxyphenol hydroxylase-like FAD-dependent oxidoreductase